MSEGLAASSRLRERSRKSTRRTTSLKRGMKRSVATLRSDRVTEMKEDIEEGDAAEDSEEEDEDTKTFPESLLRDSFPFFFSFL